MKYITLSTPTGISLPPYPLTSSPLLKDPHNVHLLATRVLRHRVRHAKHPRQGRVRIPGVIRLARVPIIQLLGLPGLRRGYGIVDVVRNVHFVFFIEAHFLDVVAGLEEWEGHVA